MLGKTQQIIGRDMEKFAESLDVCQTGFILVILNVGDFSLGHIEDAAQLTLVQLFIFPQETNPLAECYTHSYHRNQFTIDANFLLNYRRKTSIIFTERCIGGKTDAEKQDGMGL